MQRLRRAAFPLALIAAIAVAIGFFVENSSADLENLVFTSRTDHVRVIVPRGWRASDQPSYPGLLLWMARSQPQGQIVLTSEAFTRELYCSWPITCRASHEALPWKYACALRPKLEAHGLRVEAVQAGPKDNEAAGLPSIWFEYQDGKHFLRHAIAFSADRAFSLVLSAPNSEARATHTRAFEQALRTMRLLTEEERERAEGIDAGSAVAGDGFASDGAVSDAVATARTATPALTVPSDAGLGDAARLTDAAVLDGGGIVFESSPAPRIEPVGPCPTR